jgi:hypothetical protein
MSALLIRHADVLVRFAVFKLSDYTAVRAEQGITSEAL